MPPRSPADGGPPALASLLTQARAAHAGLAAQPLPIANRDLLLIQKLFGG